MPTLVYLERELEKVKLEGCASVDGELAKTS